MEASVSPPADNVWIICFNPASRNCCSSSNVHCRLQQWLRPHLQPDTENVWFFIISPLYNNCMGEMWGFFLQICWSSWMQNSTNQYLTSVSLGNVLSQKIWQSRQVSQTQEGSPGLSNAKITWKHAGSITKEVCDFLRSYHCWGDSRFMWGCQTWKEFPRSFEIMMD